MNYIEKSDTYVNFLSDSLKKYCNDHNLPQNTFFLQEINNQINLVCKDNQIISPTLNYLKEMYTLSYFQNNQQLNCFNNSSDKNCCLLIRHLIEENLKLKLLDHSDDAVDNYISDVINQ
jgi:hypothetical protein